MLSQVLSRSSRSRWILLEVPRTLPKSMAGNQPSDGQGSAAHFVASHKDELYDIMYRIKALAEQDPQLARQFPIENPTITRHLFQAQIMLGMLRPPETILNPQQAASQPPKELVQPVQQAGVGPDISGAPQHHHPHPMLQLGMNPPLGTRTSFPQGQQPVSHPPIQPLHQADSLLLCSELSTHAESIKGTQWRNSISGSTTLRPLSDGAGQSTCSPPSLTGEMVKALVQQVRGVPSEAINLLSPEQRHQLNQ